MPSWWRRKRVDQDALLGRLQASAAKPLEPRKKIKSSILGTAPQRAELTVNKTTQVM